MRSTTCRGACITACNLTTLGWSRRAMELISFQRFATRGNCPSHFFGTTLTASMACVSTFKASATAPEPPEPRFLRKMHGPTCTPSVIFFGKEASNWGKPRNVRWALCQKRPIGGSRSSSSSSRILSARAPELSQRRRRLAMAALAATSRAIFRSVLHLAFHTISSAPAALNSSTASATWAMSSVVLCASMISAMTGNLLAPCLP
mmetsp:Transcript_124396/g.359691  ORF Transcript_124396/g.359691 Transcript_124396/m.359691 type:complete len:205 (+) Transcript_124396:1107-1721(+)